LENYPLLLRALGEVIAKKRLAAGMSQQTLAYAAGVHRSYMSDVERGLRNVTLGTLENIAQALQISSADLLGLAYQVRTSYRVDAESS